MERAAGIEPASSAWKAEVLPLNYARRSLARSGRLSAAHYFLVFYRSLYYRPFCATQPIDWRKIGKQMVQGGGFEPPKLARQIYSLIPLATREPLPKQSALSGPYLCLSTGKYNIFTELHAGSQKKWSWREESNPRPADYKSAALPTELRQRFFCPRLNVEAGF